jgi:hypothetical protein
LQNIHELGIRRIGILMCFHAYKAKHGKYPECADDLLDVSSSILSEKVFQKYHKWCLGFIGESE